MRAHIVGFYDFKLEIPKHAVCFGHSHARRRQFALNAVKLVHGLARLHSESLDKVKACLVRKDCNGAFSAVFQHIRRQILLVYRHAERFGRGRLLRESVYHARIVLFAVFCAEQVQPVGYLEHQIHINSPYNRRRCP